MTFVGRPTSPGGWTWAHRRLRLLALLGLLLVATAGSVAFATTRSSHPGSSSLGGGHRTVAAGRRAVPAASGQGSGGTGDAPTTSSPAPLLGVYTGPGAAATAEAVDQQLGGKVRYALDYLSQSSWAAMTDPSWLQGAWAGSPFDLIIGVPMLPESGGTMADGAQGDYDAAFSLLAGRLVGAGLGSAVLMVGWQPDDAGTPWYVATVTEAADYVRYWDAIESVMSAVPGAHFVFEWDAGDSDTSPVSPVLMYPGDAAVGMVATDAFDMVPAGVPAGQQWAAVVDRAYGPAWTASFASEHHKPLAVGMWGVVPTDAGGGGDAPAFVSQLLGWATTARARMCVLWDYGAWAITGGAFPSAETRLGETVGSGASTTPGG